MKMTLGTSEAASILVQQSEAFTYAAALALVEYLEDIDEDMELDPIALRCEYSEHSSASDWADDYFGGHSKALDALDIETEEGEDEDEDAIEDAAKEYARDNGTLIEFDGGVIISSF
jgi:hypothetical protein